MNNELGNCRINPSARVFNNQNCDSNSEPDVNAVSNFFNSSTLTNPYDKNEKVVGSNLCNKGTVAISSSNVSGSYQVQYVSQKKDIKYTKIVESKWSSEKTEKMSKEETYKCSTQTAAATSSHALAGGGGGSKQRLRTTTRSAALSAIFRPSFGHLSAISRPSLGHLSATPRLDPPHDLQRLGALPRGASGRGRRDGRAGRADLRGGAARCGGRRAARRGDRLSQAQALVPAARHSAPRCQ